MSEEIDVKLKELETTVEYSKVVVPKGMRSAYWRYFGFPADDNNQIVTKNKILCVLCNTAIVYNKNTTNLRTHLVAKHSDEFIAMTQEKRRDFLSEKSENYFNSPNKKMKLETEVNVSSKINKQSQKGDVKISDDIITEFATELDTHEQQYTEEDSVQNYEYDSIVDDHNSMNQIGTEVQQYNVNDLIQKMLVLDLLPPSVLKGEGFKNLIRCMGGEFDDSKINDVKQNIEMIYQENLNKKLLIIEQKSSTLSYSISVEFFENLSHPENSTYVNICFIFLDIIKPALENIFYKTVTLHDFTDLDETFYGIDLKNCVAVVVNKKNSIIEQFFKLNTKNAEIIMCLDAVLQNCLKVVFNLQDVNEIFEEAIKIYEKVIVDYEPELHIGLDEICIWNKIYVLQRFTDTVSLKNDANNIMEKIDEILTCINPLKVTMETIADEQIPSCTLVQPLISKLVDFNYTVDERDSELIKRIKIVVTKELTENVVNNIFLTEAAFMDPRFQHYIEAEAIKIVKTNLLSKYDREIEIKLECDQLKNEQIQKLNQSNLKCQRKSSLKLFFNQSEERNKTSANSKNSLESELCKYYTEGNIDLEQCPVVWWKNVGFSLKHLSKISQNYFTIPCSANNVFKKSIEERIDLYNRRRKLTYKYLNQLWFLHINNIETEFTKF